MVDACDPDANIEDLRKLIKLNTGVDIKLTKKEICEAYNQIQEGKLPLPPMVMNSTRTYLVDKKSPLNPSDYEKLFDSSTKRADLKRIARKVGLKNVEQMTKMQITDAIGKRLPIASVICIFVICSIFLRPTLRAILCKSTLLVEESKSFS